MKAMTHSLRLEGKSGEEIAKVIEERLSGGWEQDLTDEDTLPPSASLRLFFFKKYFTEYKNIYLSVVMIGNYLKINKVISLDGVDLTDEDIFMIEEDFLNTTFKSKVEDQNLAFNNTLFH